MDVIIGTAGHIDHGKTSLVKTLTGVDADRLPEEKQRGITIDIGFAELTIDNLHIGFVDVPGHERFVKNMLAGASGIDLVLLVVAADEGVMPQTREHFDICRLLDIRSGIIAITKSDLADEETLDLVRLEIAELTQGTFLENTAVVPISSTTGKGIEELKQAILIAAGGIGERTREYAAFLAIDRSFAVKGFGTVVTGTLASGEIKTGDEIELLPSSRRARVRGLQSHGMSVEKASSGRRIAVNLGGIDHSEVARGEVLAEPGPLKPTQILNAHIELLDSSKRSLKSRQRVRVHIGTTEALARVAVINEAGEIEPGNSDLIQIRLETPVVTRFADRFIIRSYSPQITIAGGKVVDAHAEKYRRSDLTKLRVTLGKLLESKGSASSIIRAYVDFAGRRGISLIDLQSKTGWRPDMLIAELDAASKADLIVQAGDSYVSVLVFEEMKVNLLARLVEHHQKEPLSKGMSREALRGSRIAANIFETLIVRLKEEKRIEISEEFVTAAARKTALTDDEQKIKDRLIASLNAAVLQVPKLDELIADAIKGTKVNADHARKILKLLYDSGEAVKVSDDLVFAGSVIGELIQKLRTHANTSGDKTVDVPKFKELAGVSRKYAIPLLEHFDREKITIRSGDKRIIR